MHGFFSIAALIALAGTSAIEIGTSPPPTLKYSDFALDGKTTYCYTVREGLAAAMFAYTELGVEGKGDECPMQLSLEQTTTGEIGVNQNVGYKFTATVSLSNKNLFNGTALTQVVEEQITKKRVQISRANVHACSSSSVCDAFRMGNNSRVSEEVSANFTDGKSSFASNLNFSSPDTYTVFAYVVVPGPTSDGSGAMRFVAYTTTTVGSNNNATNSEDVSKPDGKTLPSSSPPKEKSAAGATRLAATVTASVTLAASLFLLAF